MSGPDKPEFLDECAGLEAVRKRYGISLPTLYGWMADGLPSMKIGRERKFHLPTVDAWVKAQLTGSLSTSGKVAQGAAPGRA